MSEQQQKAPDYASGSSSAEGLPAPPPHKHGHHQKHVKALHKPGKVTQSPREALAHVSTDPSPSSHVAAHVTGDARRTRARTSSHARPLGLQRPLPASQPSIQVPRL